jgi:hypothetical protein
MFYFMEGVVEGALPPKAFVATGHNHWRQCRLVTVEQSTVTTHFCAHILYTLCFIPSK